MYPLKLLELLWLFFVGHETFQMCLHIGGGDFTVMKLFVLPLLKSHYFIWQLSIVTVHCLA
jgi:hypothetical protein